MWSEAYKNEQKRWPSSLSIGYSFRGPGFDPLYLYDCNSSARESDRLIWLLRIPDMSVVHCRKTPIYIKKKSIKVLKYFNNKNYRG